MAFDWANVLVAPTGSTGLDTGSHTSVDEPPPWSDSDEAVETVTSSSTEVAVFSGFDLSNAGGEPEGYQLWARMRTTGSFLDALTVKQDTTTLWESDPIPVTNTSFRTFMIPLPIDGDVYNNLSVEWSCQNQGGNATMRWSWMRISKSPFTNGQKAVLPSALVGQEFVCYRASDLGVLGAVDGEAVLLLPDASGAGRHSVLMAGAASYETDIPESVLNSGGRFAGTLGFDPVTGTDILWSGNKIFHAQVYPSTNIDNGAVFSAANASDFIGTVVPDRKHLLSSSGGWVLMSGDGSAEAHLAGGTVPVNESIRVTEWVQVPGNEHMWENDDDSPVVDGSSGDNAFNTWSILDRETSDRPFLGRLQQLWFIDGTGITESSIDAARGEWVTGIPNGGNGGGDNGPVADSNRIGGFGAIRRRAFVRI